MWIFTEWLDVPGKTFPWEIRTNGLGSVYKSKITLPKNFFLARAQMLHFLETARAKVFENLTFLTQKCMFFTKIAPKTAAMMIWSWQTHQTKAYNVCFQKQITLWSIASVPFPQFAFKTRFSLIFGPKSYIFQEKSDEKFEKSPQKLQQWWYEAGEPIKRKLTVSAFKNKLHHGP